MKPRFFPPTAASASFTLVEMLVAVTVLALIMVFVVQFVSLASRSTINDGKKIEAVSQARQAFDRFGLDWNAHVSRGDVPVAFLKNGGNDEISFMTEMPSPDGSRSVAVVDYRIDTNSAQLERGISGYNWNGSGLAPFTLTNLPSLQETNFQALSPGVFRMEFCLLSKASATNAPQYWWPAGTSQISSLTNVAAVLVAVAALDDASRKLITTNQLENLAAAFPDMETNDPVAAWQALLSQPNFASAARVPLVVAQAVRVYERYFYVTIAP